MNKIDTVTAGLPLFETPKQFSDADVKAIIEYAHRMRNEAIAAMIKGAFASIKGAFRARRTARALHQLSDSVLADIGIERSQITSISQQLANGTYSPEAVAAAAPIIGLADVRTEAAKDDDQPELPLAA